MTDIAAHIRIFETSPTDDFVEKRVTAIGAISAKFEERKTFPEILTLADGLAAAIAAKGPLPKGIASDVEKSIKDASPSFVLEDRPLEALVCAALGVVNYLSRATPGDGAANRAVVLALALWSALSFQRALAEAKLEKLRGELLDAARDLSARSSESSRQRSTVPEPAFAPVEGGGWAGIAKSWDDGPLETLNALRRNAALDREEIDVLWWVLADWSEVYQEKLSSMDQRLAPLVAAWEIAQLLKRLPAAAHKHLVLRLVEADSKESLTSLIAELGERRAALSQLLANNEIVANYPHVFPLLTALSNRSSEIAGDKEARGRADWASRALLESGLVRVIKLRAPIS